MTMAIAATIDPMVPLLRIEFCRPIITANATNMGRTRRSPTTDPQDTRGIEYWAVPTPVTMTVVASGS